MTDSVADLSSYFNVDSLLQAYINQRQTFEAFSCLEQITTLNHEVDFTKIKDQNFKLAAEKEDMIERGTTEPLKG